MLIGLVGVERTAGAAAPLVACTVAKAGGQLDPTTTSPINFLVTFSAPVTGFDGLAINFAGSTAGGDRFAEVSGSGTTYNVAVTGMTTSGDIAITVVSGYTTPPNSLSTSADNTVAWLGAAGGWQTLYTQSLGISSDGWGSYTLRQVISTSAYGAGVSATASAIRVTVDASGTSGFVADHIRVGHAPASGDANDYDGTQVPLLLGGSASWTVAAGVQALSDSAGYSFNKSKNLVLSIHFPSSSTSGVEAGDIGAGYDGYYKATGDVDDTVTTDASGYTLSIGRLYAFSKVEVFVSTGPTLQALFGAGYAETDTFGAHTVTLAAIQALTATGYAADDVFAGHTVSATGATQNLTATGYAADDAFSGTHTVGRGAVGLTATRYTGDDAFAAATVLNNQPLVATGYTGDDAFATHVISAPGGGAWHDLFTVALSTDSAGWADYSIRQAVDPSVYLAGAPATGTKIRVTIHAGGAGIAFDAVSAGHKAPAGDVIDYDGNQIQLLWSTSVSGTVASNATRTSDGTETFTFDKTKALVMAIFFTPAPAASDVKRADPGTGYNGGWHPTGLDNTMVSDVVMGSGVYDMTAGRLYMFTKVEVFG